LSENILKNYSDEFFSKVVESLPLGILLFNSDGRITYINNNFLEFCVYHKLDLNPSTTINLFKEDLFYGTHLLEYFQKIRNGYSFETEIEGGKSFSLRKIIIVIKGTPLFKNGKFDGGILIIQDVRATKEDDESLKTIEPHWDEIINSSFDLFLITDDEGIVKYSFGKRAKRFLSRLSPFEKPNVNFLFSQEANNLIKNNIKIVKETLALNRFNLVLIINNRPVDFECEIEPVLDAEKRIKLLLFRFNDIKDYIKSQKLLEEKIRELSENKTFLENLGLPVFAVDLSGKITLWNKASQELFGFSEFQAIGKYFIRLIGITEQNYFEDIKKQFTKSKQINSTFKIISLAGQEEIINTTLTQYENENPQIIFSCQKITDKIQIEKKFKRIRKQFDKIIKYSAAIIFNTDSNGNIIYANDAFLNVIELSQEETLGKSLMDFCDPEFNSQNSFQKITYDSDNSKRIEIPLSFPQGKKVFLSGTLHKDLDTKGQVKYYGNFQDISNTKIFSSELTLLTSVLSNVKDGLLIETQNKITRVNDAFVRMFGYNRNEDLIGKTFIELVADQDVKRISEYIHLIRRKVDAPERFEFLGKHEDGSNKYFSATASEFEADGKSYVVIAVRDISEKRRAQEALRESEEKYRSLIENLDDFFYTYILFKNKFKPTLFTEGIKKITGYSQSDFFSDPRLIFKIILPDDIHQVKLKLKENLKSKTKNSAEFEFRILNKIGNIVWVRNKINVIRDEHGKVIKLYGIVNDITNRKKVEDELRKSKEDLLKINETKDKFLSIVSHDLRTPFSSILGFTDMILSDEKLSDNERNQYVRFIQESSHSMLSLVNSLLDWNRLQSGRVTFEPEKISASKIINKSITSLSGAALRKSITIKSTVKDDIEIFVDPSLIGQVFNNLISNAIKFTNPNGNINISSCALPLLRFLEFRVEDNGTGIRQEDFKKLFSIDSKFITDGTSGEKGSGMGLSIVHEIIQKHGGTIRVESEVGTGSKFIFTLPIGSAVILLVDDSKTDRLLYSKILKSITPDYNVEIASNGDEALEKIKKYSPALVISDHNMPKMDGIRLVQEIQKLEAKLKPPIIILSGDIDRSIILEYSLLGITYVFKKPVNLANFKQAVERMIRTGLLGN
jgi:PAS domain S-box-containing protein